MQLTNPIWLWGLTGLLIPIGIHLLSRKEGKVIKFGSLRYLEESQTKQSISVRLNEIALLIIRCTLIFLIVMLLSGLSLRKFTSQKSQWIILEQGMENDQGIASLVDSLKQNGFEAKSMAKGFPGMSTQDTEPFANYWEMVNQLPMETLNKVIIVSYNLSSKFRGKRIALPENVTWISKEPEQKEFVLSRVRFSNDSVIVRAGKSSSLQTSFTNVTELNTPNASDSDIPQSSPDTVHISIYAAPGFDYDQKIVTASLHAIEQTIPVLFKITKSSSTQADLSQQADWLIWLSKNGPTEGPHSNRIIFQEDRTGNTPLLVDVTQNGDNQEWLITKRLNEEIALKEQLTLNLTSLLVEKELVEARADSLDQTTRPEKFLWSQDKRSSSTASIHVEDDKAEPILLVSILIMLMVERFVAFKRNA